MASYKHEKQKLRIPFASIDTRTAESKSGVGSFEKLTNVIVDKDGKFSKRHGTEIIDGVNLGVTSFIKIDNTYILYNEEERRYHKYIDEEVPFDKKYIDHFQPFDCAKLNTRVGTELVIKKPDMIIVGDVRIVAHVASVNTAEVYDSASLIIKVYQNDELVNSFFTDGTFRNTDYTSLKLVHIEKANVVYLISWSTFKNLGASYFESWYKIDLNTFNIEKDIGFDVSSIGEKLVSYSINVVAYKTPDESFLYVGTRYSVMKFSIGGSSLTEVASTTSQDFSEDVSDIIYSPKSGDIILLGRGYSLAESDDKPICFFFEDSGGGVITKTNEKNINFLCYDVGIKSLLNRKWGVKNGYFYLDDANDVAGLMTVCEYDRHAWGSSDLGGTGAVADVQRYHETNYVCRITPEKTNRKTTLWHRGYSLISRPIKIDEFYYVACAIDNNNFIEAQYNKAFVVKCESLFDDYEHLVNVIAQQNTNNDIGVGRGMLESLVADADKDKIYNFNYFDLLCSSDIYYYKGSYVFFTISSNLKNKHKRYGANNLKAWDHTILYLSLTFQDKIKKIKFDNINYIYNGRPLGINDKNNFVPIGFLEQPMITGHISQTPAMMAPIETYADGTDRVEIQCYLQMEISIFGKVYTSLKSNAYIFKSPLNSYRIFYELPYVDSNIAEIKVKLFTLASDLFRLEDWSTYVNYQKAEKVKVEDDPFASSIVSHNYPELYVSRNDGLILKNEPLETTEVDEYISPPSTDVITIYKNRLWAVDDDNNKKLVFSNSSDYLEPIKFGIQGQYIIGSEIKFETKRITSLAELDEKLIIFGLTSVIYLIGEGTTENLKSNDLSYPVTISSTVGSNNHDATISTQYGVFFSGVKGMWLLKRDLSLSNISFGTFDLDLTTIHNVYNSKNTNEIYWYSPDFTIVFNYLTNQFYIHDLKTEDIDVGEDGVPTFLYFEGFLAKNSLVNYEDNHLVNDPLLYEMRMSTNWIKSDKIQDFIRFRRLLIKGKYISEHELTVKIYYHYDKEDFDTYTITPQAGDSYQYEIHLKRQKSDAIKIEIFDTPLIAGGSFEIEDIHLEIVLKKTSKTVGVSQKFINQ